MRAHQIIKEMTAGCVATVAKPMGETQSRYPKVAGLKPVTKLNSGRKKGPYANSIVENAIKEDEINEEDKIIAPGKGRQFKPGLLAKSVPSANPTDTVKVDIPLLIRLLEFAREDASNDVDLHDLAEKLVARGSRGKTLTMKDYEYVVDECMSGGVIAGGGVGEGLEGAAVGGVLGAMATKSPQGAMTGANLGSTVQDMFTNEGAKVDRMVKHIAKSERGLGHSKKEAETIAWKTANKRGYLDNKNKKKGK